MGKLKRFVARVEEEIKDEIQLRKDIREDERKKKEAYWYFKKQEMQEGWENFQDKVYEFEDNVKAFGKKLKKIVKVKTKGNNIKKSLFGTCKRCNDSTITKGYYLDDNANL